MSLLPLNLASWSIEGLLSASQQHWTQPGLCDGVHMMPGERLSPHLPTKGASRAHCAHILLAQTHHPSPG